MDEALRDVLNETPSGDITVTAGGWMEGITERISAISYNSVTKER